LEVFQCGEDENILVEWSRKVRRCAQFRNMQQLRQLTRHGRRNFGPYFHPDFRLPSGAMRRAVRAALFGLVGGMVLAAAVLGVLAARRLSAGCDGLSAEECNLERQMALSLARQEALGALGLTLVSGGLAIALRRR
jgi:hypothetical protein